MVLGIKKKLIFEDGGKKAKLTSTILKTRAAQALKEEQSLRLHQYMHSQKSNVIDLKSRPI